MRAGSLIVAAAVFLLASAGSARADGPDRDQCAKSYESAQRARQAHQLKAAREQLLVCSRNECQAWIKKDCVPWLGQVEQAMPSIVVVAHDPDGKPENDVRITIDGTLHAVTESISLDPGEHTVEVAQPGVARVEQHITLAEGEHDRKVDLTITPVATTPTPPTATPVGPPPAPSAPDDRPVPTLTWILAGTGVVAAGVGTYFQVTGMSKHSDLDACKGHCTSDEVVSARATLWTGNIVLGVAVVALIGAAVVYFTRPSVPITTSAQAPAPAN